jgi:hypothetical protein
MARVPISNRLPRRGEHAGLQWLARLAKESDAEYLERLVTALDDRFDDVVRAINTTHESGGAGSSPIDASYLVQAANGVLSAERVVTDTATVTWDFSTPGQAKANSSGGSGLTHPQVLARTCGA